MTKKPHHAGSHQVTARRVTELARNNPNAICWRDGLRLDQHEPHNDGTPAYWTGGHTIDAYPNPPGWYQVTEQPPPGPWIAAEASTCNYSHGATKTNKLRNNPHSRRWLRPGAGSITQRSTSTTEDRPTLRFSLSVKF